MDQTKRVSVIIPTYNRWPRICKAIDSVLNQSEPAVPVVVDDASSDATPDKLKERFGDRIKLICQPTNKEKSAARNIGIKEAETEFVCFLDSDDCFAPDAVKSMLSVYDASPDFDGVSFGACEVKGDVEIPPANLPSGNVLSAYLKRPFLNTISFMIRKKKLVEIGGFREDLSNMEDFELFTRLMARMEFRPCGAVVSQVEKQADSASIDFEKIIAQGTRVIDYLQNDPVTLEAMGDDFKLVRQGVYHELARALYKGKNFEVYCKLYPEVMEMFPEHFGKLRYRRRYWVSRFFSLIR